jgi:excisionase family DNA binding protein
MDASTLRRRRTRRPNPVPPRERLAVPVDVAADLLSCSRRHLYDLITEGQLVTIKVGRRRLVPRAELERLLAKGTGGQV